METDRITYIYLYTKGDVKYILNRSIPFENVIGKKLLNVLNLIGVNMYSKILFDLETELQNFTYSTDFESAHIKILETHSEWQNIKLTNQKDINLRKNELAKKYNAVIRKDDIEVKDADKEISVFVVATIKKMLINVSNIINTFIHDDLNDKNNILLSQNKLLKNKNNKIQSELSKLTEQYNKYVYEVPQLEKKYNTYITRIYDIEPKKQEYDRLENKINDLKSKIESLNNSICYLSQKEGKLKSQTNI